jgi:hypothetical protein
LHQTPIAKPNSKFQKHHLKKIQHFEPK